MPDPEAGAVLVCATCGQQAAADPQTALTWVRGLEAGRAVWTCPTCSRMHLRSIEGKLDSAWW